MIKKIGKLMAVAVLLCFTFSAPVYAVVKSDDTVVIEADEVVDDDLFVGASEVIIEGMVNGDVYVGANRSVIRGRVNGDVIAGAQTIEVTGTISQDLRAGANTVSLIGATVGDSISVGANELSIDGDSHVGGGLLFGGRSLSLDGSIGRGITSGGQNVRIDGPVGRTVRVAADAIRVGSGAVIQGDLEYSSDTSPVVNGTISGTVRKSGSGLNLNMQSILRTFSVGFTLWAFLGAAIVGAVLVWLFPALLRQAHKQLMKNTGSTIGKGLIATLAVLPAIALVMFTFFGIPLALTLLVIWLLGIYFAKFFVAYTVGEQILQRVSKQRSPRIYPAMILGLVLYYLLRMMPVVGIFVRFSTTVIGLGMIVALYSRPKTHTEKGK